PRRAGRDRLPRRPRGVCRDALQRRDRGGGEVSDPSTGAGTSGTDSPVVTLDGVSQRFVTDAGEVVHALAETSLTIPEGQFVCVVGPSGCGKTTLLKILAGFLAPTGGAAHYRGAEITRP